MRKNSIWKTLGYLYIPLAVASLIFVGWLIYYHMFLNDTIAIQTNFIDDASFSEDEKFFIEINHFSNEKQNGEEVVEIKFNYYIEADLPNLSEDATKYIYSSGVQFYIPDTITSHGGERRVSDHITSAAPGYGFWSSIEITSLNHAIFYDQDAGQEAFNSTISIEDQNQFIWDIEGQLAMLQLRGDQFYKAGSMGWQHWYRFDSSALIGSIYEMAYSLPKGEHVKMLNLSEFFTVYLQNTETGKFEKEVADQSVLEEWTFVNVQINKSDNGMIEADQSIFGSYKGDTDWTYSGSADNYLYWADSTVYEIGVEDFKYITTSNGYEIELKNSCIDYLQSFENIVLEVNINLDLILENLNVIGLTADPFKDFKVKSLSINSTSQKTFSIYDPAQYKLTLSNVEIIEGGENNV